MELLKQRIYKAGLMTEWKSFAVFAVEYLGMPENAMPFYDGKAKYRKKANMIAELILESGSFGCNKDYGYRENSSRGKEYMLTFFTRMREFGRIAKLFPYNASRFFMTYVYNRIKYVVFG